MGNTNSIIKINFEDMQTACKSNSYIIINTMHLNNQGCLIKNTIDPNEEVKLLNNYLSKEKKVNIIIYGENACDESIYKKYQQLTQLGFYNVYLYPGGMFEWLLIQEVYGEEEFPTTNRQLDILKYKGVQRFGIKLLESPLLD